ncbi:hypothetical protein LIER_10704 [Lithospermum erythrorhizon]|uniref:Uncharacterized protein n=1 Tax=Lithospermum erythrorhizon TaxID=34254 RepID=A0AAV3PK77_LITER
MQEMEPSITTDLSNKKKELLSTVMQRTSEWIFSQEIPSDLTVIVSGASFSLHKFPLVSKSGYLKKLLAESTDSEVQVIEIPDSPGGAEAFELAAKFCYGINFEIGTENSAMLRCAAEYLEMTEEYAVGNLVGRTEAYLNEVALKTLSGAVSILHSAESFLEIAEKVKLVDRCIDMIAYIACKDGQFSSSGVVESGVSHPKPLVDWSVEDIVVLRIDLFQRVLIAMMARGFKHDALGPVLMLYAQKSLRGLEILGRGRKTMEPKQEFEKRLALETIVSLLPKEKNAIIPVSFLSMLLRAAIYLKTTVSCRLDLEKRISLQLGQAALDDLLISSYSITGDTLFDIDTVQRIMMNYLQYAVEGPSTGFNDDQVFLSSPPPTAPSDMERVAKLMENYLAEIASDRNLTVSKFVGFAELIPEQARITDDGMYRAIDIYLKAHPASSDTERKKICSVMDCKKLSREACAHAAQNDRLPIKSVVQVLYFEHQRLRGMVENGLMGGAEVPALPPISPTVTQQLPGHHRVGSDELPDLKRENQDLKLELIKAKMMLQEMEKSGDKSTTSTPLAIGRRSSMGDKPPMPRKSFMSTVSRKLGKLYPLIRVEGVGSFNPKARNKSIRDRRHSIS